ncbi:MAG: hypothetical protein IPF95_01710 [Flavobacteriales bacterium]|nr:hypothetical protein [Flavobacteriales bacterium]
MSKVKKTILISLSSLFILSGIVVWHIHAVTKPKPNAHLANLQLARIDFSNELSPAEAAMIRSSVDAMPGVANARVNLEDRNLVYAYDRSVQDQAAVLAVVNDMSTVPGKPLVVTAEAAAMGCPAMVKEGMTGQLVSWITSVVR